MVASSSKPDAETPLRLRIQQRIARGDVPIPVLRDVARRVVELANDPDASASDLSALVHRDPALAAHVLRVVNSAAFAGQASITSLQQAVTRLGMARLRDIAVAVSVAGAFESRAHKAVLRTVWTRSLARATWAREVARQGRRSVETAFVSGLLKDIGLPVALQLASEEGVESTPTWLADWSGPLGLEVVEAWRLPGAVGACIAYADDPDCAGELSWDVWTVGLASALVDASQVGGDAEEVRQHGAVEALNLYPEDLDGLFGRADRVADAVRALSSPGRRR